MNYSSSISKFSERISRIPYCKNIYMILVLLIFEKSRFNYLNIKYFNVREIFLQIG